MQNQINLTPITQLVQQIRAAELSQAKNITIDIQKARMLVLALAEIQDKLLSDYESMFNELKNGFNNDVVTVELDGGGFEDSK